jgi:hypothetical protein
MHATRRVALVTQRRMAGDGVSRRVTVSIAPLPVRTRWLTEVSTTIHGLRNPLRLAARRFPSIATLLEARQFTATATNSSHQLAHSLAPRLRAQPGTPLGTRQFTRQFSRHLTRHFNPQLNPPLSRHLIRPLNRHVTW